MNLFESLSIVFGMIAAFYIGRLVGRQDKNESSSDNDNI